MRRIDFTPAYRVTRDGRVFKVSDGQELAQHLCKGYPRVTLQIDGKSVTVAVHRLVARDFLPPAPSPKHQIRHLDGVKTNRNASNLAWGTAKENAADRKAHGHETHGERHGQSRFTEEQIASARAKYASYGRGRTSALAAELGTTTGYASRILSGGCWKHLLVTSFEVASNG